MARDEVCEAALRGSEAKYRAFFETVQDAAIVIDIASRQILEANRQMVKLSGWSLEELQQKCCLELSPPEEHSHVERLLDLDTGEQAGTTYELVLVHRDTTRIPVDVATSLYVDEAGRRLAFGVLHDLWKRRAREAALHLEETRLEAILKLHQMAASEFEEFSGFALEEGVRLTSSEYGFLALVSRDGTTATLYSLSRHALRDCHMNVGPTQRDVLLTGSRAEAVRSCRPVILNDLPGNTIRGIPLPDGHVSINRLLHVPILDRGRVVMLAGVANKGEEYTDADIRQLTLLMSEVWSLYRRRKAEEEGRRLEARMKRVRKLESLGIMAGGIAHDFNNILMTILGNAELVRLGVAPDHEAAGHLDAIRDGAKRAAELCRQMLAYAGKGFTLSRVFDLNELLRELMHGIESRVSKNAVVDFRADGERLDIEADPVQIRQVVLNLVANASEALGENPGTISVRTKSMDCDREALAAIFLERTIREGRYVVLEIGDTGCGMEPWVQERMFDPFFTTKFTGRGLGLSAVVGIVRSCHGAIRVTSRPTAGTTVSVFLPSVAPVPRGREAGIA
ncbi:MAG TPA: GAF domain-containing protein [Candidatus Ozemobacteraceae bacterium]|nr:GAF domain-containing protein [Candidatus Ozemobacteraceae bacterium]